MAGTESQGPATERAVRREVERRRTFAIISHPDAGKTTLTEKLLLYGGQLREAGAVRARRAARHATSDWLELERQRGISVSSSVMTFDHRGFRVNILDTPGHHDFSEDTYRTLTAADSAVMLIDAAKGVEPQTRKLFDVCRMRGIPIFTFVNKMDREGRDPLDLMGEIEDVLGIHATPVNWPVGTGSGFRGVYDIVARRLIGFSGGDHGSAIVEENVVAGEPGDPAVAEALGPYSDEVADALDLLEGAGESFDPARVLDGKLTPMYFGSALTNFGVLPFLDSFLSIAPAPAARGSDAGPIDPVERPFSGFVFKIQANMDPDHRDRVAFVRICSGRFTRGANTIHTPSKKKIRLANSTLLMAQDRQQIEEAFAGDVVGLFDPGIFRIGDTLSDDGDFEFEGIPTFSPEHFVQVRVSEVLKRKSLHKGIDQLTQEGLVQRFTEPGGGTAVTILGAVGPLQFDVLQYRMKNEYGVDVDFAPLPYRLARWPVGGFDPGMFAYAVSTKVVEDREGNPVILFDKPWSLQWTLDKHPDLVVEDTAPRRRPSDD